MSDLDYCLLLRQLTIHTSTRVCWWLMLCLHCVWTPCKLGARGMYTSRLSWCRYWHAVNDGNVCSKLYIMKQTQLNWRRRSQWQTRR